MLGHQWRAAFQMFPGNQKQSGVEFIKVTAGQGIYDYLSHVFDSWLSRSILCWKRYCGRAGRIRENLCYPFTEQVNGTGAISGLILNGQHVGRKKSTSLLETYFHGLLINIKQETNWQGKKNPRSDFQNPPRRDQNPLLRNRIRTHFEETEIRIHFEETEPRRISFFDGLEIRRWVEAPLTKLSNCPVNHILGDSRVDWFNKKNWLNHSKCLESCSTTDGGLSEAMISFFLQLSWHSCMLYGGIFGFGTEIRFMYLALPIVSTKKKNYFSQPYAFMDQE